MWERFSYYGMRALFVLYLLNYLQFQPADSSAMYKWYMSLACLTPLIGGFLADRFLGLRASVITGAVLMAIGHFLMAFEPLPALYMALAFIIAGNGFFKPSISTLVGKMYRQDDARRDGAFTIFYMGISLGAFMSPILCGWLRQNMGPTPGMGYHYGFAAAGVGMVLSLIIFLVGQKQVLRDVEAAGNLHEIRPQRGDAKAVHLVGSPRQADEAEPGIGGFGGAIVRGLPWVFFTLAAVVPTRFVYLAATGQQAWTDAIMPSIFAIIGAWMGWTLRTIKGAARDKSTIIFVLIAFVILFFMALEQAGNALNVWAEYNTLKTLGPLQLSAEYFQAANPIFGVIFAPLLAVLWTLLSRHGRHVSVAAKMLASMVLMAMAFGAMVASAAAENGTVTQVSLASVPREVRLEELNAGRLRYDPATQQLSVSGVLAPFAVTQALRPTVNGAYMAQVEALDQQARYASEERPVTFQFQNLPEDYVFPLAGPQAEAFAGSWSDANKTVTMRGGLSHTAKAQLVGAGAPPEWRQALSNLAEKSKAARVSGLWLLLSYLLATLGELCLAPVGLSMVTKLAPARFASLFMGAWLISVSVSQYLGGSLGEMWGRVVPSSYFAIFIYTSLAGALVLLILQSPLNRLAREAK
ncbi:proton/peptide symporter family protein [Stigmatella aurantiaca DW4/3-1]|nr:proton/peptide symporter family protein [Stigmatella aurantiaca DW4/3-1]